MNIGIIGLGLIGGSLGLDFRAAGHQVLGVSRRQETVDQALAHQVVHTASTHLASLATAEVVFICTPIAAICPTVRQLTPHLQPDTIITDVGSVKGPLVAQATALWPNFVGGHPMAGKAEAGLAVAEAGLFIQRPYVLTPLAETPIEAVATVETLVKTVRARLHQCSPTDHDRAVAWISHLPVMVSTGLIQACLGESNTTVLQLAQDLASSGFRDTSRVGGGNPELGMMMAQFNRDELLRSLHSYRQQIDDLLQLIDQQHWPELEAQLKRSQAARPQFLEP
ncbi:MAG: prephenate/arogenate dehydrogenase [Cyanobacteria bacterium P01_A01_bin.123]